MPRLLRSSVVDQTVEFLRKGIRKGRWSGRLPGALRLSKELDVSKETLLQALGVLEEEGLILFHGSGKHREVVSKAVAASGPGSEPGERGRKRLRVGILPYEDPLHSNAFKQRQLLQIAHEIEAAGHSSFFAPRSQMACKGDVSRIAAMVRAEDADVWIVMNSLQEIMAWFRSQGVPAFAVGGRVDSGLPSAAYSAAGAMDAAMDRMVALGHRRIILVSPQNWRRPVPSPYVQDFLSRLKASGIPAGEYNVPDWVETPAGFEVLLKSLFTLTPPTAMILADSRQALAVTTFLSSRGLRAGRDLSFVVRLPDPAYEWTTPSIAHFTFDENLIVRRVVRWLAAFAKGRPDSDVSLFPMSFVDGATLGPADKSE